MSLFKLRLAASATCITAPIALAQAIHLRRTLPRLPEAAGARSGVVGDGEQVLRLLVFGESTAAGVGAATQVEALGGQAAEAFAAATGRSIAWQVVGKNGVTARTASAELTPQLHDYQCDVAIIAIGANDTFRLRPATAWQRDLVTLLYGIRHQLGPIPMLFSGLPPVGEFPSLRQPLRSILAAHAKLLNAAAKETISQLDLVWHIDTDLPTDASFYGSDRFHPGPKGYTLWGQMLATRYCELFPQTYDITTTPKHDRN